MIGTTGAYETVTISASQGEYQASTPNVPRMTVG